MWTVQAALLVLAASNVSAFWRMQCYQPIVTDRVDPIVQPGVLPAKHIHNIMGGSAFTSDSTWETLQKSDCTSCRVKADKSSYWVPTLYFQESNGAMYQVPQKQDMLVYYIPERGQNVQAFPKNFKMVAGDPTVRNFSVGIQDTEASRRQRGVGFNCLNYAGTPEAFLQRRALPTADEMKGCLNGLRSDIAFPSCWNGELDSANHRDHVAYPSDVEDGTCPDTHPQRLVTILYETLWDVAQFFEKDGTYLFANGDATGYGFHGDFLNGWDVTTLETAMKDPTCVPPQITATGGVIENCGTFTNNNLLQTDEEMGSCSIKQVTEGTYEGPMDDLPGCNTVSYGPAPAAECNEGDPLAITSSKAAQATTSSTTKPVVVSTSSTVDASPLPSTSSLSLIDSNFFGNKGVLKASSVSSSAATAVTPAPSILSSDPYVVIDYVILTETVTKVVNAKRTAAPEVVHERHAQAHAHRRRRWAS